MWGIVKEPIKRKIFTLAAIVIAALTIVLTSGWVVDGITTGCKESLENQRSRRAVGKAILRRLERVPKNWALV